MILLIAVYWNIDCCNLQLLRNFLLGKCSCGEYTCTQTGLDVFVFLWHLSRDTCKVWLSLNSSNIIYVLHCRTINFFNLTLGKRFDFERLINHKTVRAGKTFIEISND